MTSIAIVVEDPRRFAKVRYFVKLLMPVWQSEGWTVRLDAVGDDAPKADIAILHVDATRLDQKMCEEIAARHGRVINLETRDTSKRRVSRQLIVPGDGYQGPVIVKTNGNCGAVSERRERYRVPVRGLVRRVSDRLRPWAHSGRLQSRRYPIFDSVEKVPLAVWDNPDLVVERFLAERHGELYGLRQWVFLGDRDITRLSVATVPVIKSGMAERTEMLEGVPESLRARREELGFDFGKFDYVMHNGEAVLLDANRTPTYARVGEAGARIATQLAKGIEAFR